MSDSLIQLPAMARGASFAGTCLTHTMIFTRFFLDGPALIFVLEHYNNLRLLVTNTLDGPYRRCSDGEQKIQRVQNRSTSRTSA